MFLLLCILALCAGCTSIESTMVTRDESNQDWERHNCLNGIPITLKVPTHLKLYVFEKHYLQQIRDVDGKVISIEPVEVDVAVRDFAHEFMYTEKIFVVDFKRPPAGSANLRMNMTEDQYIDEIQHDITEQTVTAVTGLLGAFTGKPEPKPGTVSGNVVNPLKPDFKEIRSLVAVGIFEIDAPDFEQKIKQFLDCHVNKSHDAWVVPPHVDEIHRVGIGPKDNGEVPYPPVPLCTGNSDCPSVSVGDASMVRRQSRNQALAR